MATWTSTFVPANGVEDADNVISVDMTGARNTAGNTGTGTADSSSYAIDTARPTATIVVEDHKLVAGETTSVKLTFSGAVTGFDLSDLSVAHGTLTGLTTGDTIVFTTTLTPTPGVTDATNVIVRRATTSSSQPPARRRRTSVRPPTASRSHSRESATSLATPDDLTVIVVDGTLSAVASIDDGVTFTATFTPSPNVTVAGAVITVDVSGVTDATGNGARRRITRA